MTHYVLDNTNLTMAQQLKIALDKVNEKINSTYKHNKVTKNKLRKGYA